MTIEAKRIEYLGYPSVLLGNDEVRAVFDAQGSMVPLFGARRGRGILNAHWLPDWRATTGTSFDAARHGRDFGGKLLYHIAGDFICSPGFGPPSVVEGAEIPPHGYTANEAWSIDGAGVDSDRGVAWGRFGLRSPAPGLPLAWDCKNLVLEGQPAYYAVMSIRNAGDKPLAINVGRHNTLGAPFLQAGCRVTVSARRLITATKGTEFEDTSILEPGAEFTDLAKAPRRGGGAPVDMTYVPGITGYSDFVTGPVPESSDLGWICCVNPVLGLAYVAFFPGPARLPAGEIALSFNDLWLQYGGRDFRPWALVEGAGDRTFCLGVENATANFATGLAAARAARTLLGAPTTVEIPARGEKTLVYGTALVAIDRALAEGGVSAIEAAGPELVLKGKTAHQRVKLSGDFAQVRTAAAAIR